MCQMRKQSQRAQTDRAWPAARSPTASPGDHASRHRPASSGAPAMDHQSSGCPSQPHLPAQPGRQLLPSPDSPEFCLCLSLEYSGGSKFFPAERQAVGTGGHSALGQEDGLRLSPVPARSLQQGHGQAAPSGGCRAQPEGWQRALWGRGGLTLWGWAAFSSRTASWSLCSRDSRHMTHSSFPSSSQ